MILGLVATVASTLQLNAQGGAAFGIHAGASFAKVTFKDGDENENTDTRVGLTLGVIADMPISSNFSFQPQLNFVQKGGKEGEDDYEASTVINYLELPLNFVYKTTDNGSGHFFVGAGPYLGFAIGGKSKVEVLGEEEEVDLEIGNDDGDDIKPFDLGINVLAGYKLPGGIFISANYTPGLINIAPGAGSETTVRNGYFGVRVGFMLGAANRDND